MPALSDFEIHVDDSFLAGVSVCDRSEVGLGIRSRVGGIEVMGLCEVQAVLSTKPSHDSLWHI